MTATKVQVNSSGKIYVTSDNKILLSSSESSPVISTLNVTPTTSAQQIVAPDGIDGYSPVNVSAVTSSIDSNITAANIKSGVSILGVSGSVDELKGETQSVSLTNKNGQTFTPSNGKNGITSITVTPNNQARTVTPTTSSQSLTINSGYSGNGTITVNAVTSSIDSNITAANIKDGVTILGVTGTYEGSGGGSDTVPSYQIVSGALTRKTDTYNLTGTEFSGATSIGDYGLYYAFSYCTGLTGSIDLSNVTSIGRDGLNCAFFNCTGLTSVDLSNVTSIGRDGLYQAFTNCSGITSVDLSSVTSIGRDGLYYAFFYCTGLIGSVDLSNVTSIDNNGLYNAFYGCSGITSVDLSSVTSIASYGFYQAFRDCRKLQTISFDSLKTTSFGNVNAFNVMFSSTTGSEATGGCTVHFPSNLQSTISGLTGYPTFGGNANYITLSFDLPATS